MLEFNIDFIFCGAGQMLNEVCESLQDFIGYYLDSILIEVHPTSDYNVAINIFDEAKPYSPQNYNQEIETTEDHVGGQINFTTPSITASSSNKNNYSTKSMANKWKMRLNACPTNGVKWSYMYVIKTESDWEWPTPCPHSGYWYTKEMLKGFRITITQI
ncbi:4027_t:CDS:1 [Dentiscutata erythropus]|uniref:4027_t:CDS:1 n=1 Tax=Dentiscutata erythropus TaxID=1348616 RepID=A0A9N9JQ16_9GLOM|nr:4027_t:CDS:1 [Dentiscutata erythropus]